MNNYKEGAQYVYDFTKEVIDKVGPRLPGSEEERAGAEIIAEHFEKATGNKAVTEPFTLSPRASIGAIPVLGAIGLVGFAAFYISPIASLIIATLTFLFAVLQIFTYTGALDVFFKKEISNNVYSVLEPPYGKVDRTFVYSGHNDSSWNWNHAVKKPGTMVIKIVLGVVGFLFMMIISVVAIAKGRLVISADMSAGEIVMYVLPLITVVPSYWLITFLSWDKKKASPGAMDNLTGVGLAAYIAKSYKDNPESHPENTRIICAGLGAEEAGLKGSMAFAKKHKNDAELLINPYVINLDSFRDYEHFNAVKGDLWLFSRFDKDMIRLATETYNEIGVKNSVIINPIGGCDSTPFHRINIPTVTLNAQNPVPTDYYHTFNDHYDGLDMPTLEKSCEAIIKYTDKLVELDKSRKSK